MYILASKGLTTPPCGIAFAATHAPFSIIAFPFLDRRL
jgi:hypothetical protein